MRAFCASFVLVALLGCGSEEGSPAGLVRADARSLAEPCARDTTLVVLAEVDGYKADRLPVRASERIREVAVPATPRTIEALTAVVPTTPEGRAMQGRLLTSFRRRIAALESWSAALSLGEREDVSQLSTLRAHREAEDGMLRAIEQLEAMKRDGRLAPDAR